MEMFYITPPGPLDCNLFSSSTLNSATPAFSYPTTAEASLEEARSLLAPASVSPKLFIDLRYTAANLVAGMWAFVRCLLCVRQEECMKIEISEQVELELNYVQ
ncbi:hypothetical protein ACB094_12G023300 [Castanea mollissima]